MGLRSYSILRRYWWLTNFIAGILFMAGVVFLESRDIDPYWAVLLLVPALGSIGIDLSMKITVREALKIMGLLLVSIYGLVVWGTYAESHMLSDVFSIDVLYTLGGITMFLGIATLLFGVLPIAILINKDKKHPRTFWRALDGLDAGYFVFRNLPNEIASRTTLTELQELLIVHNPITGTEKTTEESVRFYKTILAQNSQLNEIDLKQVIQLRDVYEQQSNIVLPKGYATQDAGEPKHK